MASVVISSTHGGQLGGDTGQTYYCFDCDRTLTIIASSDSGLVCPICGHVVLEEFETPASPPPPSSSTTFIDPFRFFHTSDTDSDDELSSTLPLPPPPPPLPFSFFTTTPTISRAADAVEPDSVDFLTHLQIYPPPPPPLLPPSRSIIMDFHCPLDSEVRHLRPSSRLPPPPPPPLPQFPVPSPPHIDDFFLLPPEENDDTTQYGRFGSALDALQPPLPPPPLPEHLLRSPPLSPSSSSEVSELFYPTSTGPEEDTPNWPPIPPLETGDPWVYFFGETELNSPNHRISSELQPPPPPPWMQPTPPPQWLQMPPKERLPDMKMTEKLVSEWECHQCSICIDNFELNQKVKLTPCNHLYHSDCLLRWLDLHKSCPVCRCKLPSH